MTNIYIIDNKEKRRGNIKVILEEIIANPLLTGHYCIQKDTNDIYEIEPNCPCRYPYSETHCPNCAIDCKDVELIEPFLLFIHASNKCYIRFLKKYSSKINCIISYSGGDPSSAKAYQQLLAVVENIPFVPYISEDDDAQAIRNGFKFEEHIKPDGGHTFDLLERKGTPYLSALSILCIGFLAQHKKLELLPEFGVSGPGLESLHVWDGVFGPVSDRKVDNADEIISKFEKNTEQITKLLRRIFAPNALPLSSEDDVKLVLEAYNSITACIPSEN